VDDDLVAIAQSQLAHARGKLLGRGQHVRQRTRGVGDLVDIEEHRARNVLIGEFRLRVALLCRQIERAVDDADVGRIDPFGQPLGADQGVGSCVFHGASYGSAMMKRRFIFPLFSILVHSTRPISPVRATCVPPQACRSTSSIASRRTRPAPIGGRTLIVLTSSGRELSSSSVTHCGVTGRSTARILLISSVTHSLVGTSPSRLKSSRLLSALTWPPVTLPLITADMTCSAVCMRMWR